MLRKYKSSIIEFLIRSYFVGASVYVGVFMLSQSLIEVALIIGLTTHFIADPIIEHMHKGNKTVMNQRLLGILKNMGSAFILVTLIYLFQMKLPLQLRVPLEPISFSLVYQCLWTLQRTLVNLFKGRVATSLN